MGRRRKATRGITFWIGLGMVAAGLSILAWVGWQMFGTNWTSKREQGKVTAQLQQSWAKGQATEPRLVPTGQASALIRIPRFGKDYVVPVLEGVATDVLAKGYGHFTRTADPGEVGNYALAAHRVTHGEPLRRLPEMRPGDEVIVETATATYTYKLLTNPNDLVVPFTGVWVTDPLPKNPDSGGVQPPQKQGQKLLTLTTCSELFHTDKRMIAFAALVKAQPKPAPTKA